MIVFDEEFLILHEKLNRAEAILFTMFLHAEYKRHCYDAHLLLLRIAEMEKKHKFDIRKEFTKLKECSKNE